MEEGRKSETIDTYQKISFALFSLQVDLDCEDGVFALLGPSGCGKNV